MTSSTGTSTRDLAALLLAVLIAACERPPVALDEVYREGYRRLEAGDVEQAASLAERGARRARQERAPEWQWPFEVLAAETLVLQRRSGEALDRLDAAWPADAPDDAVRARALMTRGYARCFAPGAASVPSRAAADLAAAARLAAALGDARIAAEVTLRVGTCALLRNDPEAAEASFRAALAAGEREGLPLIAGQAAGSLGNLRARQGRFDDAARWLRRSLDVTAALPAEGLRAKTWGNLGWCYLRLGDHERAVHALAQAASRAHRLGLVGDRMVALTNLGRALHAQGDYVGAQERFLLAAAAARELDNPHESAAVLAEIHATRAALALEQERYEEAASLAREAARLHVAEGDAAGRLRTLLLQGEIGARRGRPAAAAALYREVIASPGVAPEAAWEARVALARLHVRAARNAEAEVEFARAFELMERSLAELLEMEHRLPFFSSLGRFHDDYVDFLVTQGRVVEALAVADRSHARLLRERLGGGAGLAADVDYPRLARELDAVLLSYWTAADRSFLWIVTPAGVELATLPGEGALAERVAAHQGQVLRSRDPLDERSADAAWLYDTLVRPAAAAVPASGRVLVVPDGPLHQLNFETLVAREPHPRYWLEDVVLALAPSLRLLDSGAPTDERPAASLLVLGDPLSPGDEFPPLPFAAREIAAIASLFPAADRQVLSGARAQPAAYRQADPGRFAFIHFAAHAVANREVPLDSAVVLSAREQDFKLYAREIVSVRSRAELVTLSACRGAGSRAYEGEGLVGLAWAFLGSGAANVVGGLWNVEDASTAELMEHLYRQLTDGADPAVALRRAKLRLLRSGTAYRKPFYWGPFVVYTARPRGWPRAADGFARVGGGTGRCCRLAAAVRPGNSLECYPRRRPQRSRRDGTQNIRNLPPRRRGRRRPHPAGRRRHLGGRPAVHATGGHPRRQHGRAIRFLRPGQWRRRAVPRLFGDALHP